MNRLGSATSPYLLQHQHNPVDWWEWTPEAFADAEAEVCPYCSASAMPRATGAT